MPTRLREEHEQRMREMSSPLLPGHSTSSSSRDIRPPRNDRPPSTPTLPAWASLASSAAARGSATWNPEPEKPKSLAIYRHEYQDIEPQHELVINRFHKRTGKIDTRLYTFHHDEERLQKEQQAIVDRMYQVQQANQAKRQEKKREKRRKEKVKLAAEEAAEGGHSRYDGDVDQCIICLEHFTKGEQVSRLICRHVLHEKCLTEYLVKSRKEDPGCPECRGTIRNPRGYKFIAENQFEFSPAQSEAPLSSEDELTTRRLPYNPRQTPETPPPQAQDLGSSNSTTWSRVSRQAYDTFFPCWEVTEFCYHGNTRLADGRQGLLVDPGAWSNLVGETWAVEMARKALNAGHRPGQVKLDIPLDVAGVGKGTNSAEWEVHIPIAIDEQGDGTKMSEFRAPSVGGPGKALPALLGLRSMSRQGGVLEMAEGREYLTFPGPGGYQVEWSPGTRRYKLERAISGHLILPCDAFDRVSQKQGGLEETRTSFYTGTPQKVTKTTCEIGTQTDLDPPPRGNKKERLTKDNTS
jgi:hypothetical protein